MAGGNDYLHMRFPRTLRHSIAVVTGGLVLLSGARAASAHVDVDADDSGAGDTTLLTFSVAHGCEGSPSTEIRIQIPETIPTVAPTINPGWDVDKVMEQLATPITDAHSDEITERVSEVVYTATTPTARRLPRHVRAAAPPAR